jgi:hypothetical protein
MYRTLLALVLLGITVSGCYVGPAGGYYRSRTVYVVHDRHYRR